MRSIFSLVLLFAAVLALPSPPVVVREPVISLPLTGRSNVAVGTSEALEADRVRARRLVELAKRKANLKARQTLTAVALSVPITDQGLIYTMSAGIGSSSVTLFVDTGSSNTWAGARTPLVLTSPIQETGENVSVSYISGSSFFGKEVFETITLPSNIVVKGQSIGAAFNSTGFEVDNIDGIIGLGPAKLTQGSLIGSPSTIIDTVLETMKNNGIILNRQFSVSLQPFTTISQTNGEITFGGFDASKITGSVHFVPITTKEPSSRFWGVDTDVNYGGTPILTNVAGFLDTGTASVVMASDGFQKYKTVTGATTDPSTGLLKITPDQLPNLKPLNFVIGGNSFTLTADAQLQSALNTKPGDLFLAVIDGGKPSNSGSSDVIFGVPFLRRYLTVYDADNNQVGIATTPFTNAVTN